MRLFVVSCPLNIFERTEPGKRESSRTASNGAVTSRAQIWQPSQPCQWTRCVRIHRKARSIATSPGASGIQASLGKCGPLKTPMHASCWPGNDSPFEAARPGARMRRRTALSLDMFIPASPWEQHVGHISNRAVHGGKLFDMLLNSI